MVTLVNFFVCVIGILAVWSHLDHSIKAESLLDGSQCTMKDGRPGMCRNITSCKSIDDALRRRTLPFKDLVICFFIRTVEYICCPDNVTMYTSTTIIPLKETVPSPTPKEVIHTARPSSRAGERKAEKVCSQLEANYNKLPKSPDFHILDGEPTYLGEFPHMAAIGYPSEDQGQSTISFDCGGSLVSDQYVLTAAHCVNRPERRPTLIRLGTVHNNETSSGSLDIGVESIILHPEYKSSRQHHDIALIRLNASLSLDSSTIYPACLHTDRSDIAEEIVIVATGWGSTSTETRKKSNLLLKVNLTSVDWNECNAKYLQYSEMRRLPNGLNGGQLCAFDPNHKKDTCEGDSGGPLQLILDSGMSKIVGITSFGISCASSIPSVYARVAFYIDWLETILWPDFQP